MQTELKTCEHCGASMAKRVFKFDILDCLLLIAMAQEVRTRKEKGSLDFTVANQVHVPSLSASLAVRCRTTQMSKLGLVAKLINTEGRHVPGVWVITERGWKALKGEPVPSEVKVYRKDIIERTDKLITIAEAFKVNSEKVAAALARNKTPKHDYRKDSVEYSAAEWAGFGDGRLF